MAETQLIRRVWVARTSTTGYLMPRHNALASRESGREQFVARTALMWTAGVRKNSAEMVCCEYGASSAVARLESLGDRWISREL